MTILIHYHFYLIKALINFIRIVLILYREFLIDEVMFAQVYE